MLIYHRFALLRKYIAYNMLFILVPMLLLIAVYVESAYKQIVSEHETTMRYSLQQAMRAVEADMEAFQLVASQIALDEVVTPYVLSQGRYDTVTALKALRGYHSHVNFLESVMLYLHGGEKLYAGVGIMNVSMLGGSHYPFAGGWDTESLQAMLDAAVPYAVSPAGKGVRMGMTDCLVITYPWARPAMPAIGSVVGILPGDYFAGIFTRAGDDVISGTMLSAADGQWLYADEAQIQLLQSALTAVPEPGQTRARILGETCTVVRLTSEKTGFTYVSVLPHGQFMYRLLADYGLALTWAGVLLLVLIAAGVLIAIRNYLPIYRLDRMLGDTGKDPSHPDELGRIGASLTRMSEWNRSMQAQLVESRKIQREQLLQRLLHAQDIYRDERFREALSLAGIRLDGPLCAMVLSGREPLSPDARETLVDILTDEMDGYYCVETGTRDYIAVIAMLGSDTVETRANALLAALARHKAVQPVYLAAGQAVEDASRVGRSLSEAIFSLETMPHQDGKPAFFEPALAEQGENAWMAVQTRLVQWLRQGNAELTRDTLKTLSGDLTMRQMASDTLVMRYVAASVSQQVFALLAAAGAPADEAALEGIMRFRGVPDFIQRLGALCDTYLHLVSAQQRIQQNEQLKRVLAYVDGHYTDPNFSLKAMAHDLSMTNSYLSRFFRDHAEMNFSDYVTQRRMERACALLSDGGLNIRDVVEQVGYLDVASFTRRFTQSMGVSPGRYRDMQRKDMDA